MHTIEVYKAKDGWRWRRVAENGRVVADSGEAYENRDDCVDMAAQTTTEATLVFKDK